MKFNLRLNRDVSEHTPQEEVVGGCRCAARWTGEAVSHCATCHLTFASVTGFDAHRDGRQGICRDENELRRRGFEPNEEGQWRRPMSQEAKNRIGRRE